MTEYVAFGDIVEENGKTIRENNGEQQHNIPIGTLVEVRYSNYFGDGACEKVHARLWVFKHERDCDGSPLYYLSHRKPGDGLEFNNSVVQNLYNHLQGGFSEDSLTIIEVTEEVAKGYGALSWED